MLEKLAKQTAVYGISTIAVRFLSYLLTPVFTRVFEPEAYGIVTDVYALIPFALVVLTMGSNRLISALRPRPTPQPRLRAARRARSPHRRGRANGACSPPRGA